ncbi:MAG: radical SAM protein [Clostridium sp.]|uniref:elongator complex protein 3 n=1 Tax=Clostridium sp. TaxID=1506 RepID=UPI0029104D12|nr:radical SAM protein [Clostridium sp.]MDU7336949.1 radical SAM protein [Clostridium sp.]
MKHANVAIFVPHAGCPQHCSFCSQNSITGKDRLPTPNEVRSTLEIAKENLKEKSRFAEIAFFGGSFTAINRGDMLALLEAAAPSVWDGVFSGIRISTRPDAIDDEVLALLKHYGVKMIELGAQSMDDTVLQMNRRGHTAEQVCAASRMIHSAGFSLGLQMMTGLWGDTAAGALQTAQAFAALKPDCVRIYPTIVMNGTELAKRYRSGEYHPMNLEDTVELCCELLELFHEHSIPVIRLGLHSSPEMQQNQIAGPWHPAFRELCESRLFLRRLLVFLEQKRILPGCVEIHVSPQWVSKAVGQSRCNLQELARLGYIAKIAPDASVLPSEFIVHSLLQSESR